MGELLRLKDEGKIRAIGVSNVTTEQLDEYRAVGVVDSDQERYSMLDRGKEQDLLPYCAERGIAFLAYSPIAQGLLTGKMGPDRAFGEGDQRKDNPRFSVANRRKVMALLDGFRPVTDKHGLSLTQLVIAWTVHQPGCTHALVGARSAEQVSENARAGDVSLDAEDLARMGEALAAYRETETA
jgi:aryl-alcohol dehydrogenase-like predicted oxidoreductase